MRRRRGSILVMSYLVVAFLMAWGSAIAVRSFAEQRAAGRTARLLTAFQAAESGFDDALNWLRTQPAPPGGVNAFDPLGGAQAVGDGSYTVTIDPDDDNPTSFVDRYAFTVVSTVPSDAAIARQVSGIIQTESFARYAYFTSLEQTATGGKLWFIGTDHIRGPLHTNDQLSIAGSPVFDGEVKSAASTINYRNPPPSGGNNPQFNGGLTLDASTVTMPTSLAQLRVAASSGGQWYAGNTTIAFSTSASSCSPLSPPCELVTNAANGWVNQPRPLPTNGAVFVNGGNATVSGTVDGNISVGASADVVVKSSVYCADNPETNTASDDFVGLLAERNVVVSQSAPYNLDVQASVMALGESFTVQNYWVGPAKGTLKIYGGIIQKRRGPIGTFSGSSGAKLSGYSKDYWYDSRLQSASPPYFPTTGVYQTVIWQDDD